MVKSLNDAYKHNTLFYFCNATGDINMPGDPMLGTGFYIVHTSEELPPKERELYENFWSEDGGGTQYVVRCEGKPGIAICYLFDRDYILELCGWDVNDDIGGDVIVKQFFSAVEAYAKEVEAFPVLEGCSIFVGDNTDPVGHELLVFVPYELVEGKYADVKKFLDTYVYMCVEVAFKKDFGLPFPCPVCKQAPDVKEDSVRSAIIECPNCAKNGLIVRTAKYAMRTEAINTWNKSATREAADEKS
ncbi:MAG: hypothetical protein GXY05_13725 [Clostridiales bacterium]|nr:hypothetical protein [Clostridiales bacterium]